MQPNRQSPPVADEAMPSEERVHALLESAGEVLFRYQVRPEPRLLWISDSVRSVLGRSPEDLLRMEDPLGSCAHPSDLSRLRALVAAIGDGPTTQPARLIHANGTTVWTEVRARPAASPDGERLWMDGLLRDVTAQHAALEQLRESEVRVRKLLEVASNVVCILDAQGTCRYLSPGAIRVLGLPPEHRTLFEHVHPEDRSRLQAQLAELAEKPWGVLTTAYRFQRGDGVWRFLESVLYNHLDDPMIQGLIASTQDITDRHAAEVALRRSELYHRELVAHLPGALAVHRAEEILFANVSLAELSGYAREELIGKPLVELFPADDRAALRAKVQTLQRDGTPWRWEGRLRRRDGAVVLIDVTSIPFAHEGCSAALTFMRDITEYKRVQQQLMLADRMSSVGSLAAGVAHEINNPLAYVIGNLAFVQDHMGRLGQDGVPGAPWTEMIAAVRDSREGVDRVRRIVRDLRTIAQADEQRGPVDVRRVLESCLNLAWIDIRHKARLVKDFGDVPSVEGNEARLSQVFLNLIMNALQAIPEGRADVNELKVSVRHAAAGVEIKVRDTGSGIPPDVLPRIFDPFFSTKAGGVGTGLGLSICHGVVTSLGGTIRAASEVGKGTTLTVTLPARLSNAPPISIGGRRARLMLVDADGVLDDPSRQMLGSRHELDVVRSSESALTRMQSGGYDLILCAWPRHADLFPGATSESPEVASRFLFLLPHTHEGSSLAPGARTFRYHQKVELDELLPAIRDAIEANR